MDKVKLPREILEAAIQQIADEFGIYCKHIEITWMNLSTFERQRHGICEIKASCDVIDRR